MPTAQISPEVDVRSLAKDDLDSADLVMRLAFGTFLGLAKPETFMGDADYVHTRWRTDPSAAFAALHAGDVVGSNFASHWGSVGFFGPLTIRPDLWDRGIGQRLMEPVMECFTRWQTTHAGLFTFAHSEKHIGLYQKYGFWPRYLTSVMTKPIASRREAPTCSAFSDLARDKDSGLSTCRALTDSVFDGLDVTSEIRAVDDHNLGDTVMLWDDSTLAGFAVCHCGAGTEAGSGTCFVKFAAVRPSPRADDYFAQLLDGVEQLASSRGAHRVTAGVNTGRHEAYRVLLARGFRTEIQGVAMHRPNSDGYSRPGVFVLDDWR